MQDEHSRTYFFSVKIFDQSFLVFLDKQKNKAKVDSSTVPGDFCSFPLGVSKIIHSTNLLLNDLKH